MFHEINENLQDAAKTVLREKLIVKNVYIKKQEKSQSNIKIQGSRKRRKK